MESKEHKPSNENSHGTNGIAKESGAAMPRPPAHHENGVPLANGVSKNGAHEVAHAASSTLVVARELAPVWSGSNGVAADGSWLSAFESIQNRTAEAHAIYQQTMAQCHLAFLRTAEQSALALASLASGGSLPLGAPRPASLSQPEPLQ